MTGSDRTGPDEEPATWQPIPSYLPSDFESGGFESGGYGSSAYEPRDSALSGLESGRPPTRGFEPRIFEFSHADRPSDLPAGFPPPDPPVGFPSAQFQPAIPQLQPAIPQLQFAPRPRPVRRLPEIPVSYAQLLRGPTRAWWRPIVSLLLLVASVLMSSAVPVPIVIGYGLVTGETTIEDLGPWLDELTSADGPMGPAAYLYTMLVLIMMIPAVMLSIWAVHRIVPGFLSSVAGRIRWRWLFRCILVLTPLWALYLGVSVVVEPAQSARPEHWAVLLAMGVLLTPGQAAAEEYAFRGWTLQNLGCYFRLPALSWVIPGIVAAAAFAAAHGSPDPWILADLAAFSVTATLMIWRTGGLEAAIVMHTVNNIGITVVTTLIGGWDETFVGAETRGTPVEFAVSLALDAVALALIWWQARRTGIDRFYRPQPAVA